MNKPLVSIIVNNYNYGRFLSEAIESALAQTYGSIEVIVVDDGSTDNSTKIIATYAGRITAICKQNGGQASALNAGFVVSRGEIVIFLDSDDLLFSNCVERVVQEWPQGLAKMHYRLRMLNQCGEDIGTQPGMELTLCSGDVRELLMTEGTYSSPPTSGNAFARSVLTQIMPIPESSWVYCADGYLYSRAPFFGLVRSIDECLGVYRVHGANAYSAPGSPRDMRRDRMKLEYETKKWKVIAADARDLGREIAGSYHWLLTRLISFRLAPKEHPVPEDRLGSLLAGSLRAAWRGHPCGLVRRFGRTAKLIALGFLPRAAIRVMSR